MSVPKSEILAFIKTLKVEPFLLMSILSLSLTMVPVQQLIQDKVCLYEFNQKVSFCLKMSELDSDQYPIKSDILAKSAIYKMIQTVIIVAPCIVWSMFVGSWCDKYLIGRKIVMCFCGLSALVESVFMILNAVYFDAGEWG